jgi:hypothetical protein
VGGYVLKDGKRLGEKAPGIDTALTDDLYEKLLVRRLQTTMVTDRART